MFERIVAAIALVLIALGVVNTMGMHPENIMQQIYVCISGASWIIGVYAVAKLLIVIIRR